MKPARYSQELFTSLAAVCIAALWLALLCFYPVRAAQHEEQSPILIGLNAAMSGAIGQSGEAIRRGAQIAIQEINDSGGARIQEGVLSLNGYAQIFRANTAASGVIPQISVILGPCAGGAVYSPAITDFIFMVDGVSNMFITGPQVIATVTGEKISSEDLGGSAAHCSRSGVAHFRYATEQECLAGVRTLLSYLPAHNGEDPPLVATGDDVDRPTPELIDLIPEDARRGYDVKQVIAALADQGT